jgi:hypothetical protein
LTSRYGVHDKLLYEYEVCAYLDHLDQHLAMSLPRSTAIGEHGTMTAVELAGASDSEPHVDI